jgi:hypothetical protein
MPYGEEIRSVKVIAGPVGLQTKLSDEKVLREIELDDLLDRVSLLLQGLQM